MFYGLISYFKIIMLFKNKYMYTIYTYVRSEFGDAFLSFFGFRKDRFWFRSHSRNVQRIISTLFEIIDGFIAKVADCIFSNVTLLLS